MSARASLLGFVWLVLACEPSPRLDTPHHERAIRSADAERIYARTLSRDTPLSCDALTEGVADPVPALLEIAEGVQAPPSAGMRAAACLIEDHAEAIESDMLRWVAQRRFMGLGLLVLNHLDRFEPALRRRLIDAARAGEYATIAEPRIRRATETPALAAPPGPVH